MLLPLTSSPKLDRIFVDEVIWHCDLEHNYWKVDTFVAHDNFLHVPLFKKNQNASRYLG